MNCADMALGGLANPAGDMGAAPSSPLTAADGDGLGGTIEAETLRTWSSWLGAGLFVVPFTSRLPSGVSAACEACGAGESTDPPRPPTWIVILFEEVGGSELCPTFNLILVCAGSGTPAWAFLSSASNISWTRS